MSDKDKNFNVSNVCSRPPAPLFKGAGSEMYALTTISGSKGTTEPAGSNAEVLQGQKVLPPPLNIKAALALKDKSPHHATCIVTKKNCIAGLGFLSDKDINNDGAIDATEEHAAEVASLLTGAPYVKSDADTALDPRTHFGFSPELLTAVEDFLDTGTGYLEVVRTGGDITWIGHLPAASVRFVQNGRHLYFQVQETGGALKYFSRYGAEHKKWLLEEGPYKGSTSHTEDTVSEVIVFQEPSNRVKYYGYPSWLAAAIDIDLLKKAKQYKADFYHNRGVMDFILSITGAKVDEDDWKTINDNVTGTSGEGNNYKNMALNIASPDAKVEAIKLAADMKTEDQFTKDNETFALNIVTAHGVPPLLAGIQISGKLGASNEFSSSLVGFQLLRIGPAQQIVQKVLASTLGNNDENGDLKLEENDFRLRSITSQINLDGLDTLGKMHEEAVEVDRDLNDGVKD